MKSAIFLDRDGTINYEVDNLRGLKQLRLLPHAAEAIKKFNVLGFLVIVVTNQPVVARGWITKKETEAINAELITRLKRRGAKVDAIYYCPHHPEADIPRYRISCRCRKPNTSMIQKAIGKFKIDRHKSFMIGDSTRDILAGKRVGLKTIMVKTGYGGEDQKYEITPNFTVKNLTDAVKIVRKHG